MQGTSFTFLDLSCNSKKTSNYLNSKTILFDLSRAAKVRTGDLFCILHKVFVLSFSQSAVMLTKTGAI